MIGDALVGFEQSLFVAEEEEGPLLQWLALLLVSYPRSTKMKKLSTGFEQSLFAVEGEVGLPLLENPTRLALLLVSCPRSMKMKKLS